MGDDSREQRYAEAARVLTERVNAGDMEGVEQLIDELTHIRETDLFRDLGRLTRELHESLKTFRLDSRIAELTEQDIPDARERLNYVITMTEQAAHRTLTVIEDSMALTERISGRGRELREDWTRFRSRQMSAAEFRDFSRELDNFFEQLDSDGGQVHGKLTEALMAQDYQDLTGQIIRKVINLVREVETSLVDLVRISDPRAAEENREPADNKAKPVRKPGIVAGEGPHVPGRKDDTEFVHGQDDVDDLLSSLGF